MTPEPFPHVVRRNWWSRDTLRAITAEFPPYDDPRWTHYPMHQERGKKAGDRRLWGSQTTDWFEYVRSRHFVRHLEQMTGIKGLVADELGGGMHCTGEGGRLGMHTDFSVHPQRPHMTRRLNLLVFLNEGWQPEWGGCLYLGRERQVRIVPEFNTTVIFETSARSWHGHPDPIAGDHLRRSLACYFYAPRQAADELQTTTIWQDENARQVG